MEIWFCPIGFLLGLIVGGIVVCINEFRYIKYGHIHSPNDTLVHSANLERKNDYETEDVETATRPQFTGANPDKDITRCEYCGKPLTWVGHGIGYECLNEKCMAAQDPGSRSNARRNIKSKKRSKDRPDRLRSKS